jgi:hypothetical protein
VVLLSARASARELCTILCRLDVAVTAPGSPTFADTTAFTSATASTPRNARRIRLEMIVLKFMNKPLP